MSEKPVDRLIERNAELHTQVAEKDAEISRLKAALGEARVEIEVARSDMDCIHRRANEIGALARRYRKSRAEARSELERLKSSGQVAEDAALVLSGMVDEDRTGEIFPKAKDALSRLSAGAQAAQALADALEAILREEPLVYEGNLEAKLFVTVDALNDARAALRLVGRVK